jgi:hypothetical protein
LKPRATNCATISIRSRRSSIQRFAGNGYAVIAADYLGKGPYRNGRGEAYAVKDATVQCCLDILNAGLLELGKLGLLKSTLFLNGWSQGALNTQWLKEPSSSLHPYLLRDRAEVQMSWFNPDKVLGPSPHSSGNHRASAQRTLG